MLYALAAIASVMLLVLLTVQVYRVVTGYRIATGTRWQRFLAAFSHSHTVLLARVGTFGAMILAFLQQWLPTIDPASTTGAAVTAILKPEYMPYYLLGYALLMEYMRKRPSSIDPITPPPQAVIIPPAPINVQPELPLNPPGAA